MTVGPPRRRALVSLVPSEARGPGLGHNGGPPLDGSGLAWAWRRASQRAWKTPPREIALARLRQAEALGLSYREFTAVLMDRGQRLTAAVVVIDDARTFADPIACDRIARLGSARTLVCLRGPGAGNLPEDLRAAVDRVDRLEASAALDTVLGAFLAEFSLPPAAVFLVGTRHDDLRTAERHGLALFKWATSYFAGAA
ncbi:MAG: hypothetical protein JNK67_18790 [Alphaproteobacteria bacterium]|nr:hypothetical protein [Alphaproteobacteria bacterium]